MTISVGEKVPAATLAQMNDGKPEPVDLAAKLAGRKVVLFGLPGAYTGTCTSAHVPSFIRTRDGFAAKGVDEIICVSVNDAFVMKAWGDSTGATAAGITMLADPASELTKAMGLEFSAPPAGFYDRSTRYAMYVEDGVIKVLHREEGPGMCETSGGEAMLAAI